MPLYEVLKGTLESLFSIGGAAVAANPALKKNGAVLEARLGDDSAFAKVRGASPVGADDLATRGWVEALPDAVENLKVVRFALGTATASSTFTLPANARVLQARLQVTTGYSVGATIEVGQTGATGKFLSTTETTPQAIGTNLKNDDVAANATAAAVTATIAGAPAAGVAVVLVEYVETPKT